MVNTYCGAAGVARSSTSARSAAQIVVSAGVAQGQDDVACQWTALSVARSQRMCRNDELTPPDFVPARRK